MESAKQKKVLEVIIIGGSLAGLLCGIALKHSGHSVTVIEQESDERQSHMAGVRLGIDAENFLARYDCHQIAFAHTCARINAVTQDEAIQTFLNARRKITSWDTFYFRLRSMFDGYDSSYYPSLPQPVQAEDRVAYKSNNRVLDISRVAYSNGKMVLTILNNKTQEVFTKEADLGIGADGPNSSIRTKYLPNVHRQYSGYIAWRGIVPESEMSPSICQTFEGSVTVHMMRKHHCIIYIVPGLNGSLQPGQRFLNFLWYTNESPAALDESNHRLLLTSGYI